MKMPSSVAQKKVKAVEQLLTEFNIELQAMPTKAITNIFNDVRLVPDIVAISGNLTLLCIV